jgi:RNA polymerase sigma factor (sigma-70 family)
MIFEQRNTRGLLRGMVRRLTIEHALEEDLIQEAIIHLWLQEREHPGQSHAWYIQSCRLHLQNFLRKGRSVDAGKRRRAAGFPLEPTTPKDLETPVDDTLLSLVCARDLLAELGKWLTPLEKQILSLAHDGLSLREIGERFHLSHTSVLRHRRSIAALASRLGSEAPLPVMPRRTAVCPKGNNHFLRARSNGGWPLEPPSGPGFKG